MTDRRWIVICIYSALNGAVALAAVPFCLEILGPVHWLSSGLSSSLGFVLLSFLIPYGAITLWMETRGRPQEYTSRQRRYILTSQCVLILAWVVSVVPTLGFVVENHPWPLTFRHGPDTSYAVYGFEKCLGSAPPKSVTGIYYRADANMMDACYRLRFRCTDETFVHRTIDKLGLGQQEEAPHVSYSSVSKWWGELNGRRVRLHRKALSGSRFISIWYDRRNGVVWYGDLST